MNCKTTNLLVWMSYVLLLGTSTTACTWMKTNSSSAYFTNNTGFPRMISVAHNIDEDSILIDGNYKLNPGEVLKLESSHFDVTPEYYVYSETTDKDNELLRWYFNLSVFEDAKRYQPDSELTVSLPTISGEDRYKWYKTALGVWSDRTYYKTPITSYNDVDFSIVKTTKTKWWKFRTFEASYEIRDLEAEQVIGNRHTNELLAFYDSLCAEFYRPGELRIVNQAPYNVDFNWSYNTTKDSTIISRQLQLEPGQEKVISVTFQGSEPEFFTYAKSSKQDAELLKWHFDLPSQDEGIVYHEGNSIREIQNNSRANQELIVVADSIFNFQTEDFHYAFYKHLPASKAENGVYKADYVIRDALFESVYSPTADTQGYSEEDLLSVWANNARSTYDQLMDEYENFGEFTITNIYPFDVRFSVAFQYTRDSTLTEGWHYLKPGDQHTFKKLFRGSHPNISIYGETLNSDKALIRYGYNLSNSHPGKVYFQKGIGDYSISKGVDFTSSRFREKTYYQSGSSNSRFKTVKFLSVKGEEHENGIYYGEFDFMDRNFASIYEGGEKLDYGRKAQVLNSSLKRQLPYKNVRIDYDMPYTAGFSIGDHNGHTNLGIKITNIQYLKNILGDKVPFKSGDILIRYNDLVFSEEDFMNELYFHGNSTYGGIAKPIEFTLIRNGKQYSGSALFFFNKQYLYWPKSDKWSAFWSGVRDALSLGFDHKIYASWYSQNPRKGWQYLQDKARYRQMYSSFSVGNFGGLILSPGRLLFQRALTRSIGRMGVRKGLSNLYASTMLEAGESVIWTYSTKSPLVSERTFKAQLKENVMFETGVGALFGSFKLLRR